MIVFPVTPGRPQCKRACDRGATANGGRLRRKDSAPDESTLKVNVALGTAGPRNAEKTQCSATPHGLPCPRRWLDEGGRTRGRLDVPHGGLARRWLAVPPEQDSFKRDLKAHVVALEQLIRGHLDVQRCSRGAVEARSAPCGAGGAQREQGVGVDLIAADKPGAALATAAGAAEQPAPSRTMPRFEEYTTTLTFDIPCRCSDKQTRSAIHDMGFEDTYGFLHVPAGRGGSRDSNGGFAVVTFSSHAQACTFAQALEKYALPEEHGEGRKHPGEGR